MLAAIAAVFVLAGFIKGMLGLGLPTVAMGLLATRMPPAHALAIVILPAIITNIWQTFVGPYLRDIAAAAVAADDRDVSASGPAPA